jgi:signal transduction histidine kinase
LDEQVIWLRDIFAAHQLGLALLHGQAFFVLGLSILFLARRGARMEVARGLVPLATFGFCEALVGWSHAWLGSAGALIPWLAWLRLLLLSVGYAFLFAFALLIHVSPQRRTWKQWACVGGLFAVWLLGLAIARLVGVPTEQVWLYGEITARYVMALPGGLMGAWGLRRETYRTIEPERLPLVKPSLRITGLALGCFSLFGGLIGPAAPFFPANWLNQDVLLQITGIPISLLRALCGIFITWGVIRALGAVLAEIELWLESVERVQALASERERIGRELHDGIIQSIYAAGLMLEGSRHNMLNEPGKARVQLTRAIASLNQTIQDIRRYIFELRGELPGDDLETGLRKILKDFRINTLLETEFIVEGEDSRELGAERRQHIFQIAREALTNVARHAQARQVEVRLRYDDSMLELRLSDDGVGLSAPPSNGGQGLRNIRERTRLLNGMLDIDTAPNEGLTIVLTVPY